MSAMDKNDRGQLFPVFSSRVGEHYTNPGRSRFKTKKYKLFHSTDCSPADGCVGKKVTGCLRETGLLVTKETNYNRPRETLEVSG